MMAPLSSSRASILFASCILAKASLSTPTRSCNMASSVVVARMDARASCRRAVNCSSADLKVARFLTWTRPTTLGEGAATDDVLSPVSLKQRKVTRSKLPAMIEPITMDLIFFIGTSLLFRCFVWADERHARTCGSGHAGLNQAPIYLGWCQGRSAPG